MSDIMAFHAAVEALLRETTEKIILPRYQALAAHEVIDKGGGDPVTIADREAEEMLGERLAKLADIPVVGEEAVYADPAVLERLAGDCWIVDPIDGTRNFASGQPPFGILLAMASGGEAHTGWIYDCLTGRLCIAHKSKGAFIGGERVTARPTGEQVPVAAISTNFMQADKRAAVERDVLPHYRQVAIPFCCAEQYPRLVLGTNDMSVFERTEPWDHAAGVLWLNEAGGKAARPDGSAYRVSEWTRKGLLAASSPELWDQLAARMDALPLE